METEDTTVILECRTERRSRGDYISIHCSDAAISQTLIKVIAVGPEMALVLRQFLAMVDPSKKKEIANRNSKWGWAPLHILCSGGGQQYAQAGMIAQLCEAKADAEVVNQKGTTPRMVVAATSQFAQARALMENGADPNNCNTGGMGGGARCLDMAWNNRELQILVTNTAARVGECVSGSGRQRAYIRIYTYACGEKPALWWTRLYG